SWSRACRSRPALRLHRAAALRPVVSRTRRATALCRLGSAGSREHRRPAVWCTGGDLPLARHCKSHHQRQPSDRQPAAQDPRPERRMTENLVEIRNLRVEATTDAGRRVEIIKGVSLDIAEGEIVALIGESGSGKTTIAM